MSDNQLTTYGDGRDINEDNEEIPEWARPYIRTLKAQVTSLLAVVDDPFIAGVESVTCIRCNEHYAAPLLNMTANGSECGVCVAVEQDGEIEALEDKCKELAITVRELRAALEARPPATDAGLREADWQSTALGLLHILHGLQHKPGPYDDLSKCEHCIHLVPALDSQKEEKK